MTEILDVLDLCPCCRCIPTLLLSHISLYPCRHGGLPVWRLRRGECGAEEARARTGTLLAHIQALCDKVLTDFPTKASDPDNFETWEKHLRAAEALEGGINRNSNPQAINTVRNSYDRLLAKFPLLFGYWKKYADLEFSIAGTEAAEMVRRSRYFPSQPSFRRNPVRGLDFALPFTFNACTHPGQSR